MIAKLTGTIDSFGVNTIILDVNGVGYLVFASPVTLSKIGQPGDRVSLLIEAIIREDAFNLYGFMEASEQEWFRLLTSVQGVGAKAAMAILGVSPPEQLCFSIAASDKAALTRAEGVGPKIAARIITELKDKASKIDLSKRKTAVGTKDDKEAIIDNSVDHDAISALVNLGYTRSDAYQAVMNAKQKSNDNSKVNDIIKLALKELSL